MENISCWAFRSLMQGVTDSYTGMISLSYLIERRKAWKEVDMFDIPSQRQWLQVLTTKEKECADVLKIIPERFAEEPDKTGMYGIELNCSCPSPMIIRAGQGSALIKRPQKVANMVNELLKSDKYKVSVKTRLGMNSFEIQERRIFKLLEELEKIKDPNFRGVSIHFKHAKERSDAIYDYSMLKEILDYNIPIVLNGGITNYKNYNDLVKTLPKRKNIRGIMIGREALKNPNCFVEISNMLNGTLLEPRSFEELNSEFKKLCEVHTPRDIYFERIKSSCPWYKD
jgi:tRNA-dihydrouridine synthase B